MPSNAQIWVTLPWVLLALGTAVLVFALFWDRSKGRRRCPECWYDMEGLEKSEHGAGYVCPECGKHVVHERCLLKTRRRWRLAALALLPLTLGYAASRHDEYIAFGPTGLVPTSVLILVHSPTQRYVFEGKSYLRLAPPPEQLYDSYSWQESFWLWRATRRLNHIPELCSHGTTWQSHDLRPVLKPYTGSPVYLVSDPFLPPDPVSQVHAERMYSQSVWLESLIAALLDVVHPDDWVDSGGNLSELAVYKRHFLVRAPTEIHTELGALLHAISTSPDWPAQPEDCVPISLKQGPMLVAVFCCLPKEQWPDSVLTDRKYAYSTSNLADDLSERIANHEDGDFGPIWIHGSPIRVHQLADDRIVVTMPPDRAGAILAITNAFREEHMPE